MASKSAHPLSPHTELDFLDSGLLLQDEPTEDSVALDSEDYTPFLIEEVFKLQWRPITKRAWLWSDDETSDSEAGPPKRARTRSPSPISFNNDHPSTPIIIWSCLGPIMAFCNSASTYYDIHEAEIFAEHFGSLAVAESSGTGANGHNSQHLCLSSPFADLLVFSNITAISSRLRSHVAAQIQRFLLQYTAELQVSDPHEFVQCDTIEMFTKLFACIRASIDLVRSCGHTLFVGVDEYDAPVRLRTFMHLQYPNPSEYFASPREIECLLDTYFWGPILAASDVISKLFVTGTLSLLTSSSSVNLRALDLVAAPTLQLSCGFTEPEALAFAGAFLDAPLDLVDLRRACAQYIFSSPTTPTEPVFHPQQLILHIAELSCKPIMFYTPKVFPLLPGIFELLPEGSSDLRVLTTNGLIDLLASGAVEIDKDSPRDLDGTAVTWSVLHDPGGLTYDHQGALRVASGTVLALLPPHYTPVVEIKNIVDDEVQRWALKTLSLRGMWRGAHPNADVEPSIDALCVLHTELMREDEEFLVTKYCVLDTGERVLVGSLLEAESGIPVLLAVGGARVMWKHSD
ncbi:hypothetical protein C8F04DRAFT_1256399 [Mycena alexandri]|uniref:Uncharacterized protein n=1 Tax=Mycena alexandri TaxID=1745969 RepID=A0AAD6X5Z1_9AGAR|nr:hypothetical protein C8F04DRAFT_1256399 [Mycena alexandri]